MWFTAALERGGKGKATFGIVARKFAIKQVVHFLPRTV